jgi:tetratricopeptide (TPR) repeat protein
MPGRLLLIVVALFMTGLQPALAQSDDLRALRRKAQELSTKRPSEALAAGQRALEVAEAALGTDHVEVAESLAQLASIHIGRGQPADAEPLEKRAIEIMEKVHGPDHQSLAEFLVKIASRHVQGRFAYAGPLYGRAAAIYEKAWANDPRLPHALLGFANIYAQVGRYGDAIPLYQRAQVLAENTIGPSKPMLFMFYNNNLPYAYRMRGRYAEAEQATRRAMTVIGRWFGSELGEGVRVFDLEQLARVYAEQAYYADAERLYRRAYQLNERPNQPPRAAERHSRELAGLYDAQGRYAEAEAIYRRLLDKLEEAAATHERTKAELAAIREKLQAVPLRDMTPGHALLQEQSRLLARLPRFTEMASVLGHLGTIRHHQGKHAEAEALFERGLGMLRDGDDAPAIALMVRLAGLYVEQERYADAEQLYVRALQLDQDDWRQSGRPPGATPASLLNDLGRLARKRKRPERAEQLHRRALGILEELGPDRIDVGTTLNDLAELYQVQARFEEAEPLHRRALEICERGDLSPNHPLVRTALANLVSLYAAQGRHADAERLQRGGPRPELWDR